jgi:hypothetical protein
MKKHNGGAGIIRCKHITEELDLPTFDYNSGLRRERIKVENDWEVKFLSELEDPSTDTTKVYDKFNDTIYYRVLTYGTEIKGNTFANNYSGMKGSALLIERISEL